MIPLHIIGSRGGPPRPAFSTFQIRRSITTAGIYYPTTSRARKLYDTEIYVGLHINLDFL